MNNIKKQLVYLFILMIVALSAEGIAQDNSLFLKGEKAPNVHHTGDVWLNHISNADETFDYSIVLATFSPGAKLNWHTHPLGQQLLITKGTGYYQEKGKPIQIVHKGDVIKCLPDVEHWYAASPNSDFAYLAITGNKPTQWMDVLTDEVYTSVNPPLLHNENQEQSIIELSKNKWQWMADKNAEKLDALFDEKAMFIHMGGSWGKEPELNVIKSGGIWYKKADIHEVSVKIIGNTAILLNRITLLAEVGGNEVSNPFEVTEVYVKANNEWKLCSLSFTRLLTPEGH